jgi:hypothetical protein
MGLICGFSHGAKMVPEMASILNLNAISDRKGKRIVENH